MGTPRGSSNLLIYLRIHLCRPALYSMFDLDLEQLELAAMHTEKGIMIGSLLASVVRREHFRFKEFIAWLRFGNVDRSAACHCFFCS